MHLISRIENDADREQENQSADLRKTNELIIALLFAGLLFWIGSYLVNPGTLPIKQVRIEGEFRNLSTSSLQDLVRSKVKGGFFNINVGAIRNVLLTEPWVKDVSVHRVWPDSLRVYVTEQIAVALWKDNGLLNKSGALFIPSKSTFPDNLPMLAGPEGTQTMLMNKYLYLKSQLDPIGINITALKLDARRAWMFETSGGARVLLGRKDFEERVARFIDLVPVSLGDEINETEIIDMRYPNGFAVRERSSSNELNKETGTL
jgi:cell division protein FtsQ